MADYIKNNTGEDSISQELEKTFVQADFKALVRFTNRITQQLSKAAGWKGEVLQFGGLSRFSSAIDFAKCDNSKIVLSRGGREFASIIERDGGVLLSGSLFGKASSSSDIERSIDRFILSKENVSALRHFSCGCTEMVPLIRECGPHTNWETKMTFFFPPERWDIRQALINSNISFIEKPLTEWSNVKNEAAKHWRGYENSCVLFDGKQVHSSRMGRVLSGEMNEKQYTHFVERWNDFKRSMGCLLTELARRSGQDVNAGVHPVIGNDSVFLFKGTGCVGGVYIDQSGRVNVSGPDGAAYMPARSMSKQEHYETLFNSLEPNTFERGVRAVFLDFCNKVLHPMNLALTQGEGKTITFLGTLDPAYIASTRTEIHREFERSEKYSPLESPLDFRITEAQTQGHSQAASQEKGTAPEL